MAIKPRSSRPLATPTEPTPQSHLRIKQVPERSPAAPSVDEQLEALWQRYQAKEITLDEATDVMKKISLAEARKNLEDTEYEVLAEYMRTMSVE
jgi:hypothetical protein